MDVPRLLYSGPADDTARVKVFTSESDITEALAAGWRLRRVEEPDAPAAVLLPVPDAPETVEIPQSSRKKR